MLTIFAQAMLEKGALDGASTGLVQLRYQASELLQDERALILIAVGVVLVVLWRVRR
jgi:hypothetical protein